MSSEAIYKRINLPLKKESDWRESIKAKLKDLGKCYLEINCQDWLLNCRELKQIIAVCDSFDIKISSIVSGIPETVVSAKSLGLNSHLFLNYKNASDDSTFIEHEILSKEIHRVFFQKGTLRAGEHLKVEGDVLLLGDVNPGATISAGGDVMIWGRLLGNAHAGKEGNNSAKIIALQLRPVQLRISNKVARGPKDLPEIGLAEQAQIEDGQIVIVPAQLVHFQRN